MLKDLCWYILINIPIYILCNVAIIMIHTLYLEVYPLRAFMIKFAILYWIISSIFIILNMISNRPQSPPPQVIVKINLKQIHCNKEDECCICLDSINDKTKIYNLNCEHLFHPDCIDKWVNINNTCPLCRIEIMISRT